MYPRKAIENAHCGLIHNRQRVEDRLRKTQ